LAAGYSPFWTIELFQARPNEERKRPGPGEVEIEVEASGLTSGRAHALGFYPGDPGPLVLKCSGRVLEVGSGVTHVAPGDAVMAIAGGALASHVVARAELVQRRPVRVSAEEAQPSDRLPDSVILPRPRRPPVKGGVRADPCGGSVSVWLLYRSRSVLARASSPRQVRGQA